MITETSKATDEAEIRGLIEGWASAIRAKDADGVVSHTSPESVGFFLAPPLQADSPLKKWSGSRQSEDPLATRFTT